MAAAVAFPRFLVTTGILLLAMLVLPSRSANVTTSPELQPIERFRRLIPYMTFYFAQQNFGPRPEVQVNQYSGAALPLSPYTMARRASFAQRPAFAPLSNPIPAPTPVPQYPDPLLYEPLPPPPHPPPPPTPSRLSLDERTRTLIRIIALLQQARQPPQALNSASSARILAHVLDILQTQSASTQPPNNPPHLANVALTAGTRVGIAPGQPLPSLPRPVAVHPLKPDTIHLHPLDAAKTLSAVHATTLAPGIIQELAYNTVSPPTPRPVKARLPPPSSSPSLPLPSAAPPTRPPSDDDLQNFLTPVQVPHVEVTPNGHDLHNPFTATSTVKPPPPTSTPPPAKAPEVASLPELHEYTYANKVAPALVNRVTFTQSFPDNSAEGGTPGRPGVDYPVLASIPQTAFDCKAQRYKGFFGDPETHCQVWHYCDLNGGQASFLCPNGTIFSQVALTCDWWFNVRCSSTAQLYVLNERLYKYILPIMPSFPEDFSGPLVDQYLTMKFQEQERKNKKKPETTTMVPKDDES